MKRFDSEALERLRTILSNRPADQIETGSLRRACVVILLIRDAASWSLLFSRRSEALPVHSGQVAFPGGSAEPGETLEEGALRELEEEIGIPRQRVELIGRLDDLITRTGFVVAPFVGVLGGERSPYILQAEEVDQVFEVPVEALFREDNPEIRYIEYRGGVYPSYFYHHEEHVIWGLTGRMVKQFLDVVRLVI